MNRKAIFFVFVIFFTIFGGGRIYQWAQVCQDSDGWLYEVNTRQISEVSDEAYELRVRVSRDGRSFQQDWFLDANTRQLSTDGEPAQTIGSGSVASQMLLYLKQRSKSESEAEKS